MGSWFKQTLCAAKSWCFVEELLVEKCVKRLLATYLEIGLYKANMEDFFGGFVVRKLVGKNLGKGKATAPCLWPG